MARSIQSNPVHDSAKGSPLHDAGLRDLQSKLGRIFSNNNLGLSVRTVTASSDLNIKATDSVILVDGSGGGLTLLLPPAATWGGRSPVLFIRRVDALAGSYNIDPNGTETIQGGAAGAATGIPAGGAGMLLINDGVSAWWAI